MKTKSQHNKDVENSNRKFRRENSKRELYAYRKIPNSLRVHALHAKISFIEQLKNTFK